MKRKITVLSPPEMVDDVLFDMTNFTLNSQITKHTHDCIEITIVLGGSANHLTGEKNEDIRRGDVFIILPGGIHGFTECKNLEHINISCSPDILSKTGINLYFIHGINELFNNPAKISSFHLNSTEFNDAKRLLEKMLTEYSKKERKKGDLRTNFALLLCLLAQSYSLHHKNDPVSGRLDKVINYVNEHFKEKIKLPELAKLAGLSVSQLVRTFKENCNTTPGDYILELRLNESRRLLKNTKLAISEIAYLSGFNDTNYFSRVFRKRFGTTPSQNRK